MTLRDKLETKALQKLSKPGQASGIRQWVVDSSEINPGNNVVDIATGVGGTAFALREKTDRVTAVDTSPERIEIAKNDLRAVDINFIATDASATPFTENEFDMAFIVLGLHEMGIEGSKRALQETHRISQRLIVLEFSLDRQPLLWSFLRYPLAIFEAPGFLKFSRQNIGFLLEKCDWRIVKRKAKFPFELFVCDKI